MRKKEPCHAEPVRPSAANGPERSEGAQGKLREHLLYLLENKQKQILRFAQNDMLGAFFSILLARANRSRRDYAK